MQKRKGSSRVIRLLCSVLLLFAISVFGLSGCENGESYYRGESLFTVHYLDVGQSDCAFVEVCGEYTVMIDTSDADHADDVRSYVRALGYESIDILLLTHPHSDHIGGASKVLESFSVSQMYITDEAIDSEEYAYLIEMAEERGAKVTEARRGVSFSVGEATGEFLSPRSSRFEDENDNSAVLRLTYGERSFLFMGDCEAAAEEALIGSAADLSADVIKVGHHGSNSSSSDAFAALVGARYAVISCGRENDYGHPSPYVLARWRDVGAEVLVTASISDIVAVTDGVSLYAAARDDVRFWRGVSFGKEPFVTAAAETHIAWKWVLDSDSHTVHKYGCHLVREIDTSEREYSNGKIEHIMAEGYDKCTACLSH